MPYDQPDGPMTNVHNLLGPLDLSILDSNESLIPATRIEASSEPILCEMGGWLNPIQLEHGLPISMGPIDWDTDDCFGFDFAVPNVNKDFHLN
jgi:hypothetical protein